MSRVTSAEWLEKDAQDTALLEGVEVPWVYTDDDK